MPCGIKLKATLLEDPPPTLNQVAKRIGYKTSAGLRHHYLELSRAISTRHATYHKTQFENIRYDLQSILGLRQLALDLGARGIYPSYTQLRSAWNGPIGLDCLEVSVALDDIRRQLNSLKSGKRC